MKKILIVEDAIEIRNELLNTLSTGDNELHEAEDGAKAYDLLKSNSYDVLILDYHLPDTTGIDLLRKLEDEGRKLQYPIIMLTSEPESPGSEIKDLNVVSWVLKPIDHERFIDLIDQVIDFYNRQQRK